MKENKAAGGVIAREAAQLERREFQAAEEFSAIRSTMKQDTNFIEDPVMQKALGASTADLAALKGLQNGADDSRLRRLGRDPARIYQHARRLCPADRRRGAVADAAQAAYRAGACCSSSMSFRRCGA